ncbi:MAG TPA: hypothetical protein IAC67_01675 [Candidatus Coproplasma excrementipullorum]|nr:hypothetical protein [Candidatus Coproplasma excrementipullorum]
MKLKKLLPVVFAGAIAAVSVASLTACRFVDDEDYYDYTILAVKEETVKDYNTMPVFEELERVTGKEVLWTFNTSTQYSNNNDPVSIRGIDAIYHAGFSDLRLYNYGRRNRIVAIDQYLDSMPNFSAILEARPDIAEAIKSPDGHIYSLPRVEEMGLKAYPNILFLNKAWVEKLIDGGNMPSEVSLEKEELVDGLKLTRNQFKAILQKFNDLDMDGDGTTTNEIPLSFVSGNWQGNESDLIASFGVPENTQHKTIVNGEVVFTVEDENWYNAVVELNDWYNRGLIRSSAFTQTQDEFLARGQDGRYGSFYWWEKETVVASYLRDDYIMLQPLVDDETGRQYVGVSNELEIEKGECVILSSCSDIEGLLSYFDKFFEPDYSAQLNYGSIESGAFLDEKVDGKLIPNDDHGNQSADDFRMKNAPYGVVYLTQETWDNYVEMEPRAKLRLERLNTWVKPYTYEGATSIPNLNYTVDQLNTLNRYEASLANNITAWMVNRITSTSPPTVSDWQNFLSTNRQSIDTVKSINQEAYDNYLEAIEQETA